MTNSVLEYILANIYYPLTPETRERLLIDVHKILDVFELLNERVQILRLRAATEDDDLSAPLRDLPIELRSLLGLILSETLRPEIDVAMNGVKDNTNTISELSTASNCTIIVNDQTQMRHILGIAQWIMKR